jgi:hypothetical protein
MVTARTPAQKAVRNALIAAAAARNPGGDYTEAIRIGVRQFSETAGRTPARVTETLPARPTAAQVIAKRVRKQAKKAVREARIRAQVIETLTAARAPSLSPSAGQPARRPTAPKTPDRPLHELSASEFGEAIAAGYRKVSEGSKSPFWAESAPAGSVREATVIGFPQTQNAPVVPAVDVPAIPPPDPAEPLHAMDSEAFEQMSRQWVAGQARQGHPSPFWKAS